MTACVQHLNDVLSLHLQTSLRSNKLYKSTMSIILKSMSNLLRNKSVNERGSNYDRQNRTNASLIFSNQKHESDLII